MATPALSALLSADEISALCTIAVLAVRANLDADYTAPLLEKQLEERVNPRQVLDPESCSAQYRGPTRPIQIPTPPHSAPPRCI